MWSWSDNSKGTQLYPVAHRLAEQQCEPPSYLEDVEVLEDWAMVRSETVVVNENDAD